MADELEECVVDHLASLIKGRGAIVVSHSILECDSWARLLIKAGAASVRSIAPRAQGNDKETLPRVWCNSVSSFQQAFQAHIESIVSEEEFQNPRNSPCLIVADGIKVPFWIQQQAVGSLTGRHQILECKTVVDLWWDHIGIPHAPALITDCGQQMSEAAIGVDQGRGRVFAVEDICDPGSRGEGLFWSRYGFPDPIFPERPAARVRVMPLLEGIPCRLHGFAMAGQVLTLPPLEVVSLFRSGPQTIHSVGFASLELFNEYGNDTLSRTAVQVGRCLMSDVAFNGAFAVDGVFCGEEFLPTEIALRPTSAFAEVTPELRVLAQCLTVLDRLDQSPLPVALLHQRFVDEINANGNVRLLLPADLLSSIPSGADTVWVVMPTGERLPLNVLYKEISTNRGIALEALLARSEVPHGLPVSVVAAAIMNSLRVFLSDEWLPPFWIRGC